MSFVASRKHWRLAAVIGVLAITGLVVGAWQIFNAGVARSKHAVSFTPVPHPATKVLRTDIAPDTLIGFIDVRRVAFAVRRGDDLANEVWETFANNPHEQSFRNVTVTKDGFPSTLAAYQAALVERATVRGLPSAALKASLDAIKPTGWLAVLPVGAYLATYDGDEIWILVCKWEGMSPDQPVHLGHVRVWALRAADQTVLAFRTCK
jgi:hypothetical protein